MAAVPEALEGMQLSQRFSGAAQQLQADMDALKTSLETLDFGGHLIQYSCVMHCALRFSTLQHTPGNNDKNPVFALEKPTHGNACTTGGVQALPEASMALQQTDGRSSEQADDAFRSAQQRHHESVTQSAFIAAVTPQNAAPDTDLSAFLSGADARKMKNMPFASICTPAWLISRTRLPRMVCMNVYCKYQDKYTHMCICNLCIYDFTTT